MASKITENSTTLMIVLESVKSWKILKSRKSKKISFENATILLSCQHIIFSNPAYKVIDFLD